MTAGVDGRMAEFSFAGFEMAQTVAPEINSVVTAACMRNAATKVGQLLFSEPLANDVEVSEVAGESAQLRQRWPGIQQALKAPVKHVALVNCFLDSDVQRGVCVSQGLHHHEEMPLVFDCPDDPPADSNAAALRLAVTVEDRGAGVLQHLRGIRRLDPEISLLSCCFLDSAAALSAQALQVMPGEKVLNLCAGPGSTSLVLAATLFGPSPSDVSEIMERAGQEAGVLDCKAAPTPGGLLVCNEADRTSGLVLDSLLSAFLPPELLIQAGSTGVLRTKAEASPSAPATLRRLGPFDKVLVDAPGPARAEAASFPGSDPVMGKRRAQALEELLRCAGSLVRPGGTLVYTTRSLNPAENEGVVSGFLRRAEGFWAEPGQDDMPILGAEATLQGTLVLPDQGTRHGPLYISKLHRPS